MPAARFAPILEVMREALCSILIAAIIALPFSGLARPMEPILTPPPGATDCCPITQDAERPAPTVRPREASDRPTCPTDDSGRCVPICCLIAKVSVTTTSTLAPPVQNAEAEPLPRPTNQRADSLALAPDPPVPIA